MGGWMDGPTDRRTGWGSQPSSALSYWQLQAQELSPGGRGARLSAQASPGEGFGGELRVLEIRDGETTSSEEGGKGAVRGRQPPPGPHVLTCLFSPCVY